MISEICIGVWHYKNGVVQFDAIKRPRGLLAAKSEIVGVEKTVDTSLIGGKRFSPYALEEGDTTFMTGAFVSSGGREQIVKLDEPVLLDASADTVKIKWIPIRIVYVLTDDQYNVHRIFIRLTVADAFTMEEPPFEKLYFKKDTLYIGEKVMLLRKK